MESKRGFFTIAFGKHYQKIAYNLLLSARYNKVKYPFAIITDSSNKYTKVFDKEIIAKPLEKGFFNKLYIDEYAPYNESIFIEADILIYRDISDYFDLLSKGYLTFGINHKASIKEIENINECKFNIKQVKVLPIFDGSIFYYAKHSAVRNVFKMSRDLFYSKCDLHAPFYGDEIFICWAMGIENCLCYERVNPIINLNHIDYKKVKQNIIKSILRHDNKEYDILHWSTQKTYGTYYKQVVGELKYRKTPLIIFYKLGIFAVFSRTVNAFKMLLTKFKK